MARIGGNRNVGRGLIGKAEGTRLFEKQNLGVDGRRTLKCILNKYRLINVAEDSDSWGAVVNTVMNLQVP